MGDARSPAQAHSFGCIFEQGMTASQAVAPCSDQTAFAEIAEITTRGTLHQVDGELEQTNFPRVVHALDDRAERFVFVFDLSPGAIDHRVD